MAADFPEIRLRGALRPSQADVIKIAREKLAAGKRRLHIVAPPGSGKTILGLYLWAECVRRPAVVLSPNSAIQAQWAAKTSLFDFAAPREPLISTDPQRPALLTSLTYQSVTLPRRGDADLDSAALELWRDALIEKGQAQDPDEAQVWIEDLQRHNRDYYEQRLSAYRKAARDQTALGGDALQALHPSSLRALERLRDAGLGMVIFDECHHLMEHWGRVLAAAHDLLGEPMIVGLTATPPDRDGKDSRDVERYDEFFGEVDFEVPVPAVVKDGFLAPYQDLVYFVRPAADELTFVAQADRQLRSLVEQLSSAAPTPPSPTEPAVLAPPVAPLPVVATEATEATSAPAAPPMNEPPGSLVEWLTRVLSERRLPTGVVKDWNAFERRDPDFADAARRFLLSRDLPLPDGVPAPALEYEAQDVPEINVLVPVLDRYVRHGLRRSPREEDRALADVAIQRLRMLGVQITETGCQACASPVGRVLAYSREKIAAIVPVLEAEHRVLGDRLRAVVIADYEKTSATTAEIGHLLDAEAGGAVAAFRALLAAPATDALNPILVTGSSVLIDDDLEATFAFEAEQWLKTQGFDAKLKFSSDAGFRVLRGEGSDWCPRVYVEMITELFQRGLTQCLVGTRGLLGEGWDASRINVLVDLTTVTTSMTVNQLRGRSIRLDPLDTAKLADNWDIVCLAPEFAKGLDDYRRFQAKHQTLFGVTEDGAVEKGVGHVHPSFTTLKPEGLENSVDAINADMLARVARRDEVRTRWKIGEPYRGEPKRTLEAKPRAKRERGGFPPFKGAPTAWSDQSLSLAIGQALLAALRDAGLVASRSEVTAHEREGGYVRVFLENAAPEENSLFTTSLHEVLAPYQRPRYIIPRDILIEEETWWSKTLGPVAPKFAQDWLLPYLRKRKRQRVMWHAVPAALAKNKELVALFQKHWNQLVSPGEAVYAQRGEGEQFVQEAKAKGLVPESSVHEKEVFL
ncbi:MAG: DEAD/DEAH box helicase family protein [Pirellulales bacterium]